MADDEPLNEEEETTPAVQQEFTCERCGFKYNKTFDRVPFLCNRCMRFMAKKVWQAVKQIQPLPTTAPTPPTS